MSSGASKFVKNRASSFALINSRIQNILVYIINCYQQSILDGKQYDYAKRGKISKENYLRNGLVDDYLRKNIAKLNNNTEEYTIINREATETYASLNDQLTHDDPIDIHIVDKALRSAWNVTSQIYYAIECKRIKKFTDSKSYILDIEKFTNREYKNRLPIEGQIAFVEANSITGNLLREDINKKLLDTMISTISPLNDVKLVPNFHASYISEHMKINPINNKFKIYHLFFDYSTLLK